MASVYWSAITETIKGAETEPPRLLDRLRFAVRANTSPIGRNRRMSTGCVASSSIDGKRITRDLAMGIVEDAGLQVAPRVTKKLDVLVVADPDTASGKAKKAREYSVRIIAERSFWQKLGVAVD